MFRIGSSVVSAGLIAIGTLLLVIGLLSDTPSSGVGTVFSIIAALIASYLFIRAGREIWRDLKEDQPNKEDKEASTDEASRKY